MSESHSFVRIHTFAHILFFPRFLYTWLVSWHGDVVDDGFEWVVGMERGKEVVEEGDVRMSYLHTVSFTYTVCR